MEQYGSTATYNMESVLRKNIVDSEYFRDTCMKLGSWEEVVDEIFYSVHDVEPWMSGNARGHPQHTACYTGVHHRRQTACLTGLSRNTPEPLLFLGC